MEKANHAMEQLRNKLKECLDIYYYELYDYFLDVASSDYDYKILIARRCLVLYQVFLKLFSIDVNQVEKDPRLEKAVKQDNRVMSDLSTARFYTFLSSDQILLVDDVIIHGNHMWSVYSQLHDLSPSPNVTPKVYMLSDSPRSPCIPQDFWDQLRWVDKSQYGDWMDLSNRIVNAIYYSNIPYISHLGAYRLDGEINFSAYCPDIVDIEYENIAQKRIGCKSHVLFCEKKRLPFFETVSLLDCLRVYGSNCDDFQTVIPYSFTKAIRKDDHPLFCKALANYIPEDMPHTRSQFLEQKESPTWALYQVRLFKALVSQMFIVSFFNDKNITHHVCLFALSKSFDAEISKELGKLSYSSIEAVIKNPCEDLKPYFCEDFQQRADFVTILNQVQNTKSEKDVFLDYIWRHRLFEEERLSQSQEDYCGKHPGISVNYILQRSKNLEEQRNAAVQILNLNDSGCATSTYALSEDSRAYATFLSNGEQSFRIMLERYPLVIRKMIFLEERKVAVKPYLDALFAWWEKTIDKSSLKKRKEDLTHFYMHYKGRLSDINVISILEVPEFWDNPDRENLLDFHRNYFSS